jgi:hypothetical protein
MIDTVLCVLPLVLQDRSEVKTAILYLFLHEVSYDKHITSQVKKGQALLRV